MPQEFHVIRCYTCETFQVHIVKKSNKWECKMCGEKQSLKKVYFQGSGKDCRLNVQKLNEKRILNEENKKNPENPVIETIEIKTKEIHENSKWDEFLPKSKDTSDDEVEEEVEHSNYTFNRPNKRKPFTKQTKNENKKIKLKSEEIQNTEELVDINTSGPSKWKNFISNIENKSQNVLKETSNLVSKNVSVTEENSKKSKWDCFVDNESDDDYEIPDKGETNVSLINKDSNIFSSNDNDLLDDILNL